MVCFLTALTCPKRIVKVRQAEPVFFLPVPWASELGKRFFPLASPSLRLQIVKPTWQKYKPKQEKQALLWTLVLQKVLPFKKDSNNFNAVGTVFVVGCVVQFNLGRGCKSICSTELGKGTKRWGPSSRFLKSWTVYSSLFLACCLCFSFLVLFFFTGDLQKNKVLCYHTKSRDALFRYFLDVSHSSGKRQVWALVLAHLFDRKP